MAGPFEHFEPGTRDAAGDDQRILGREDDVLQAAEHQRLLLDERQASVGVEASYRAYLPLRVLPAYRRLGDRLRELLPDLGMLCQPRLGEQDGYASECLLDHVIRPGPEEHLHRLESRQGRVDAAAGSATEHQ